MTACEQSGGCLVTHADGKSTEACIKSTQTTRISVRLIPRATGSFPTVTLSLDSPGIRYQVFVWKRAVITTQRCSAPLPEGGLEVKISSHYDYAPATSFDPL
jgi:hypothetical protein